MLYFRIFYAKSLRFHFLDGFTRKPEISVIAYPTSQ